jgi:Tfp pilus assembly protein PilF
LAVSSQDAVADAAWSRARSSHFEVLTDAGEPVARRAAERLEALRLALQSLFPPRTVDERPIVALVLAKTSRFDPLVPRRHTRPAGVAGFFQGGAESDTIVARLTVESRGPFAALDHEYAHVALNRSLPAQPLWVAEGLAEMLSGPAVTECAGGGIRTGGAGGGMPPAARPCEARFGSFQDELAESARAHPAPVAALLALRPDSPDYLAAADPGLYGRSWALVRWVVARHGLAGLHSFLEAVAEGEAARPAFEARLGPLGEAEASLLEVPPGPQLAVPLDDATPAAEAAPRVDTPSRAEVEYRLGELLLRSGEPARARSHLERALAESPDHVPARLALADVHLRRGETALASRELERALVLRPGEPTALLYDARLQVAAARARGEPLAPELEGRLVAQLEQALDRSPALYEAALLLVDLRPEPYARRIRALDPVLAQDPSRTEVALALASLHLKERDLVAAQRVLRRAREAAVEPGYRFLCERQLDHIAAYKAATVEVGGRLLHVDCRADGGLRLAVDAPPAPIVLAAASTRSFFVHGEGGETRESELVCGLQDRPVVVRYWREEAEGTGVHGTLLWISFPRPRARR